MLEIYFRHSMLYHPHHYLSSRLRKYVYPVYCILPFLLLQRTFITKHDVKNDDGSDPMQLYPWAILEYVGEHSTLYHPHGIDGQDRVLSNPPTTPPSPPPQQLYFDTTHVDSMIPIRMEYGYNETHLRWGRLPIELCIPYTTYILRSFIVPLHSYYLRTENENTILVSHQSEQLVANQQQAPIYYYKAMMELYRTKYEHTLIQICVYC
jgi:hypothetical protein